MKRLFVYFVASREELDDFLSAFFGDHTIEFLDGGFLQIGDAAIALEQFLRGARADTRDLQEGGLRLFGSTTLAVESDGKSMGLVANHLDEM